MCSLSLEDIAMLFYDEFLENRDKALRDEYRTSQAYLHLCFEDFCADAYEFYILTYIKEYHDARQKPLPSYFAQGIKFLPRSDTGAKQALNERCA
jgi:hypothetical protein